MISLIQKYLIPGIVFQSVVIGGGYGTGRELAEFFLGHGALGSVLAMIVSALAWSLVLAVAFEFSRITKSYNYRAFFQALLGKLWWSFEVIYLLIALLVLAVLGSAAGEMVADMTGAPTYLGSVMLLLAISALAYFGSKVIERAMTFWSLVLFLAYGGLALWTILAFGSDISRVMSSSEVVGTWPLSGIRYAAYNLVALAAVFFVLPRLETRKEAVMSGIFAGFIGIVPGLLVLFAMLSQYPEIQSAPVPITSLLKALNVVWFGVVFQIILFGTFIETGAGIIHSINERVKDSFLEKGWTFNHYSRLTIAVVILFLALFLATTFGIIALIAKGYGLLSYAFIAVVILPLLSVGLFKICTVQQSTKV